MIFSHAGGKEEEILQSYFMCMFMNCCCLSVPNLVGNYPLPPQLLAGISCNIIYCSCKSVRAGIRTGMLVKGSNLVSSFMNGYIFSAPSLKA